MSSVASCAQLFVISAAIRGGRVHVVTPSLESEGSKSPDVVLSALGHEYRRVIFRLLSNADDGTMEVTALMDGVAARTRKEEVPTEENRQRVRTAIHHIHLPKLESQGLVRYDSETGRVEQVPIPLLQDLRAVLEQYEPPET